MWKTLQEYLKKEWRGLVIAGVILVITVGGFLVYLKFVGLPMTRARNDYNQGMLLLASGSKVQAHAKFAESIQYWDTKEAEAMLAYTR